ncbi:MAG TPA: SDR family oxidoreductase [Terriglobales bacterium]|nr:SDR family oxidoreductase [Terriglobales bacterium]
MPAARPRVVVITGGSRGIGLATAKVFAAQGDQVIISGRDAGRLKSAAKQIRSEYRVDTLVCDVRETASVEHALQRISSRYEKIDVLFNNAGVAHALSPVEKLSVETWREVIETNLTGTYLVTRAALPLMSTGSSIVNNLSIAAVQPFSGMSAYNAAKFGALGFTKALREELREKGIRVIALLPGATNTEIWQQFWPEAPREKMMKAETVAEAILHAVSAPPEASVEELMIGPTAGVL